MKLTTSVVKILSVYLEFIGKQHIGQFVFQPQRIRTWHQNRYVVVHIAE
jgi:hypothetical protein